MSTLAVLHSVVGSRLRCCVCLVLLATLFSVLSPSPAAAELTVCNPGYVAYPPTEECLPEDDPRVVPASFTVTSWFCPANIVDRDSWAGRCAQPFENLRLMHNRSANYVGTTFGSNVIEMSNLTAGLFKLDVAWADGEIYPAVMTDCIDSLSGFAYRTRLEPGGSIQMTLAAGANWACDFYLMPTNTDFPLVPIDDPNDSIELPDAMVTQLQIAVRHCDQPVDDVRIAYDQCAANTRDTLANATSEFTVIDKLGGEQSQSQLGAVTYQFTVPLDGVITITPRYSQRTDVVGTLFDCVDGASNDQGATIGFVELGAAFTLQAELGSRFMCSAYIVPVAGSFPAMDNQRLQFIFWHCDTPVEDAHIARQSCPNADRNTADDTSVTLTAIAANGTPGVTLTVNAVEVATFINVPLGSNVQWQFNERTDVGHLLTSCENLADNAAPFQEFTTIPDRVIEPTWTEGADLLCDVYVSPTDGESDNSNINGSAGPFLLGGVGKLTVSVTACPGGINALDFEDTAEVIGVCDQPTRLATISILDEAGELFDSRALGGDNSGTSVINEVPIGHYTLEGSIHPDYAGAIVICEADGTTWTDASLTVFEGVTTTCTVILTVAGDEGPIQDPADDGADDGIAPEPADEDDAGEGSAPPADEPTTGAFVLTSAACPPGFGITDDMSAAELQATCFDDGGAPFFTITNVDGEVIAEDTTEAFTGAGMTLDPVAAGTYTIDLSAPAGYSDAVVRCLQGQSPLPVPSYPESWTVQIIGGEQTTCALYLVPLDDEDEVSVEVGQPASDDPATDSGELAVINVSVTGCPPSFDLDHNDPLETALATCTDVTPRLDVLVSSQDRDWATATSIEDPANSGTTLTDIEAGTYTIAVTIPAGFDNVVLYCESPMMFERQHGEGDVTIELHAGEVMSCYAFLTSSAATDGGTWATTTHLHPPGAGRTPSVARLQSATLVAGGVAGGHTADRWMNLISSCGGSSSTTHLRHQ